MDGQNVIDLLFSSGFKPETRRENEFIENLEGFVYYDKNSGLYKVKRGVSKEENYDEIVLSIKPVVNFLGLFSENNNYSPSLPRVIDKPSVMLKFLGGEGFDEKILNNHSLGEVFNVTIEAYGKSDLVEGFKASLPSEIQELACAKNKSVGYFATATSRGGKAGDIRFVSFSGVRPTMAKMRLGVDTTFGVVYDLEELRNAKKVLVIDKADYQPRRK